VTFPARHVNGERRSLALLRPETASEYWWRRAADTASRRSRQEWICDLILDAYQQHIDALENAR
jgi:hypothetical protein